jgi:cytochrome c-type biogenesis protein CcmH/NrfG
MEERRILSSTLADIYLLQGHMEKAVEIYEMLAKRDPQNTFYRQRLSSIRKDVREKQKGSSFKRILNKKLW